MPSLTAVRDSPISQQHSSTTPRGTTPQPPSFPTATTNTENDQQKIDPEDEEKTSLINEILRLEKSMNGALRASRDEMEILKETSAKKKSALTQMEEELENIMKKMELPPPQQPQQSSHPSRRNSNNSTGSGMGGRRRLTIATASGGSGGGGGTSDMRKSLMRQNSLLRRVSVTGDRPFFRRPPLKDDDSELRESLRRRSDPVQPPDSKSFTRMAMATDDESRQSSKGSRESRSSSNRQQLRRQSSNRSQKSNLGDIYGDSSDDSNSQNDIDAKGKGTENSAGDQKESLHSKNERIAQLQKEQSSNTNQLSYLQSKLQSIETQSKSRWEQHTSTVEGLLNHKHTLSKSVERRSRLIHEVEGCLDGYQERIEELEKEIETKTMMAGKRNGQFQTHGRDYTGNEKSDISELEEEIRRYQLRLQIHSQNTAKALHSFLRIVDAAKKNDTEGLLFKHTSNDEDDQSDKEEEREYLLEKLALDVDIQLKFLERMIHEVDSKVDEYKLLSSVAESDSMVHDTSHTNDGVHGSSNHQPNRLLTLTEECSDLLSDFISTISKTMESTVRAAPHSLSIEFQPSPCPPNEGERNTNDNIQTTNDADEDDAEHRKNHWTAIHNSQENNNMDDADLPYFHIQRKKLQLHDLQRSQLQINSNISLLQNDIQSFQSSVEEERRAHYEMMTNLQTKLGMLMERLEDGGEEIHGLVKELERWKQREDVLLKEHLRQTQTGS